MALDDPDGSGEPGRHPDNWDGSKETDIGPFTVSNAQLAALHRAGIAQEYEMYGQSETMTTTGEIE